MCHKNTAGMMAAALMFFCSVASANIVYTVDFPPAPTSEVVTGTITTDGVLGPLAASDIVAFDLTATGSSANFTIDTANAGTKVACYNLGTCGLTATATTLDFAVGFHVQAAFFDAAFTGITLSDSGGPAAELNFNVANVSVLDEFPPSPLQIGTASGASTTPEPATLALLGIGVAGIAASRLRKLN